MLSSSQGNILDDEAAVQVLSASKQLSNEIAEKQRTAEATELQIDEARLRYVPVAPGGPEKRPFRGLSELAKPFFGQFLSWFSMVFHDFSCIFMRFSCVSLCFPSTWRVAKVPDRDPLLLHCRLGQHRGSAPCSSSFVAPKAQKELKTHGFEASNAIKRLQNALISKTQNDF